MKLRPSNLLLGILMVLTFAACKETTRRKALLPNISGKAGEVIVVINQDDWEGAVGNTLRDTLTADCPFLPQKEPLYNLVNVAPNGFSNMFQLHRNIIIVNINANVTSPGVIFSKDEWAAPQCVIRINASDSEKAVTLIKENSGKIKAVLEHAEIDRIIMNAKKYEERSIAPVIEQMTGGTMHFPSGYRLKKKASDFIWVACEIQYVTQGVLVYKYPVEEGEDMMNLDNILDHSNEILKDNVPGMFENTYMTISQFAKPSIEYKRYKGMDFATVRGFWEVYNDYMGGPFVSHVFYSPDGKEMIVLQAFVYAPKYDKRHYLRQVESLLYSFEWVKDEANNNSTANKN